MLSLDYSAVLEFSAPVREHCFLLRCIPVERPCQHIIEAKLDVQPEAILSEYTDSFGNRSILGQIQSAHENFSVKVKAKVKSSYSEGFREKCLPIYHYETPLTKCSPEMRRFFSGLFAHTPARKDFAEPAEKIRETAVTLCAALFGRMTYTPGATGISTSAEEAFAAGKGVCQDYAHIFISLCRQAGIAARYVCGASSGEGSTHAWAEVFVPDEDDARVPGLAQTGTWFGIDPTRNKLCDDNYIALSCGRDFCDCQIDRGIFTGSVGQTLTVFVRTEEIE